MEGKLGGYNLGETKQEGWIGEEKKNTYLMNYIEAQASHQILAYINSAIKSYTLI